MMIKCICVLENDRDHLVFGHGVLQPLVEEADLGVDTRVVPLSTTVSPGHNTLQLTVTHDGATRVTLARVLASLQVSSTEHGVSDHARVGVVTVPIRQDGDVQALQQVTVIIVAHGVSPSSDSTHGSSGSAGSGQSHSLHILVEFGGLAQLDQHDVIVGVVGAVPWVADDAGGGDELLGTLTFRNVVLAKTNLNAGLVAVSSRHNPVLVDQGATTEMVARVQRHCMGLGVFLTLISSDPMVLLCKSSSDEQNENQRPHGCCVIC